MAYLTVGNNLLLLYPGCLEPLTSGCSWVLKLGLTFCLNCMSLCAPNSAQGSLRVLKVQSLLEIWFALSLLGHGVLDVLSFNSVTD